MSTISKDNEVVTLVNVFTVGAENQQRLVDVLIEATEKTMKRQPGFVSASIHRSFDGGKVVNYAQWRSREDFAAMMRNPAAHPHMAAAAAWPSSIPSCVKSSIPSTHERSFAIARAKRLTLRAAARFGTKNNLFLFFALDDALQAIVIDGLDEMIVETGGAGLLAVFIAAPAGLRNQNSFIKARLRAYLTGHIVAAHAAR